MINLIPEKVNFKVSATNIEVLYREREEVKINVESILIENFFKKSHYNIIEFSFLSVAELRCVSLNFFEAEHYNHQITMDIYEDVYKFWITNGFHPDSGFYHVEDSEWLLNSKKKYDPLSKLRLQHYLINGNDSYVEILASSYRFRIS